MSGLVIRHNHMARNVAKYPTQTYSMPAGSTERPATGLGIDTPPNNTVGSAVGKSIRAKIAAFGQGIRNAGVSRSMIRTADGAPPVIDEKSVRLKKLTEQAVANASNSILRTIMQPGSDRIRLKRARIDRNTPFGGVDPPHGPPTQQADGSIDMKIRLGPSNSFLENCCTAMGDAVIFEPGPSAPDVSRRSTARSAPFIVTATTVFKDNIRGAPGAYGKPPPDTADRKNVRAGHQRFAGPRAPDADIARKMTGFAGNTKSGPERSCLL